MAFRYSGSGWRVAGSIQTFGNQIMGLRGYTWSHTVDGTLGDTAHSNRVSDHNPDPNGIVRALDFFEHEPDFVDGVFEAMRLARDPRLKYAIHDNRMFASYSNSNGPAWEWREYNGVNGHETHGHLSVVAEPTADETHPWDLGDTDMWTKKLDEQGWRDLAKAGIAAGTEAAVVDYWWTNRASRTDAEHRAASEDMSAVIAVRVATGQGTKGDKGDKGDPGEPGSLTIRGAVTIP